MNSKNQNPQKPKQTQSDNKSDTRKHEYKDFEDVLKNDENYDVDTHKFKGEKPDWNDKMNNEEKK